MKLIIKRDQIEEKGLLLNKSRNVTFSLSCKVEVTQEEDALINKYQARDYSLKYYKDGSEKRLAVSILLQGIVYELKDVRSLIELETMIKQGCEEFKLFLDVMASFGGEEVIEY